MVKVRGQRKKNSVVTGAGGVIGREMALFLAELGPVVLVGRREEPLRETEELIRAEKRKALVVPADITDPASVENVVRKTKEAFGSIDLLVNNAGILSSIGPSWETSLEDFRQAMEINLMGTVTFCRAVLPDMVARDEGRIIILGGGGSASPFHFAAGYGTSKAAVVRYGDTLNEELRHVGSSVKVFTMSPGFVHTAMTEEFRSTEPGKKWFSALAERLEKGNSADPKMAASIVMAIARGDLDNLHQFYFHAQRDADMLEKYNEAVGEAWERSGMRRLKIEF